MRGKGLSYVRGFGIFTFRIFTIFGIRDFYVRDCYVREKFVAPKIDRSLLIVHVIAAVRREVLNVVASLMFLHGMNCQHRHLSNIDCFMACAAFLVCFVGTVNGGRKKRSIGRLALVAGT